MRILFDTNVIIDVVQKREPHFESSYKVFQIAVKGDVESMVPASILTDIYYVIRPSLKSKAAAREAIRQLTSLLEVCDTKGMDAIDALDLPMVDYEDAVVASIAAREKVDFIITRNTKDYVESPVPAISPDDYLTRFGE